MRKVYLTVALASVIVAAVSHAQSAATIDGTVTRPATGERVSGVRVLLKQGASNQVVMTNENGEFSFGSVPAGEVQIGLDGQRSGMFGTEQRPGNPMRLTVEPGQHIGQVNLHIYKGGVVSGKIVTSAGLPAADIEVDVVRPAYDFLGQCTIQSVAKSTTDDRGFFRIFSLEPGKYYVRAENQTAVDKEFVRSFHSYTFFPGTMELENASSVSVVDEKEADRIDFSITKTLVTNIAGSLVYPASHPEKGVPAVSIVTRKAVGCDPGTSSVFPVAGNSFRGVAVATSGIYELVATVAPMATYSSNDFVNGALTKINVSSASTKKLFSGRTRIELRGQALEGIVIRLGELLPWSGRVAVEEGSGKIPFDSLSVQIAYPPGSYPDGGVDEDGRFTMVTRTDERQYFFIGGLPGNAYIKDVRFENRSVFDEGLDATALSPLPIDIALDSRGGSIKGIVHDSLNQVVPFARTVLVPVERRSNPILYKVSTTDQNGAFSFLGVTPGNYKVFAWESVPENAWHNQEFLRPYEALATSIQVLPSSRVDNFNVQSVERLSPQ